MVGSWEKWLWGEQSRGVCGARCPTSPTPPVPPRFLFKARKTPFTPPPAVPTVPRLEEDVVPDERDDPEVIMNTTTVGGWVAPPRSLYWCLRPSFWHPDPHLSILLSPSWQPVVPVPVVSIPASHLHPCLPSLSPVPASLSPILVPHSCPPPLHPCPHPRGLHPCNPSLYPCPPFPWSLSPIPIPVSIPASLSLIPIPVPSPHGPPRPLCPQYYYSVRIFAGQEPSSVWVGWVTPDFHQHDPTFDLSRVRTVTVTMGDDKGNVHDRYHGSRGGGDIGDPMGGVDEEEDPQTEIPKLASPGGDGEGVQDWGGGPLRGQWGRLAPPAQLPFSSLPSIKRSNCYMVWGGEFASNTQQARVSHTDLVIGCLVDLATGLMTFTANGKEINTFFQVG